MQPIIRPSARAKRFSLKFEAGEALVIVPERYSKAKLEYFLLQHQNWLLQQQQLFERRLAAINLSFQHYENQLLAIPFEGLIQPVTELSIPSRWRKFSLQRFYSHHCITKTDRLAQLYQAQGFGTATAIKSRLLKSLWGSCHPNGKIVINSALAMAPAAVLDYVIAHEFAHLRYRGHGPRFWQRVERLLPEFRQGKQWLQQYGEVLLHLSKQLVDLDNRQVILCQVSDQILSA